MQRSADQAIVLNKPSIVACQTQETSQLSDSLWYLSCPDILDFYGSVATPAPEITCPKYSTLSTANMHLLYFALRLFHLSTSKTLLRWMRCSSMSLLKIRMSSKNTKTNLQRNGSIGERCAAEHWMIVLHSLGTYL
jgi:hypothetical protein